MSVFVPVGVNICCPVRAIDEVEVKTVYFHVLFAVLLFIWLFLK